MVFSHSEKQTNEIMILGIPCIKVFVDEVIYQQKMGIHQQKFVVYHHKVVKSTELVAGIIDALCERIIL